MRLDWIFDNLKKNFEIFIGKKVKNRTFIKTCELSAARTFNLCNNWTEKKNELISWLISYIIIKFLTHKSSESIVSARNSRLRADVDQNVIRRMNINLKMTGAIERTVQ